jgi:hypothetical protein
MTKCSGPAKILSGLMDLMIKAKEKQPIIPGVPEKDSSIG